MNRSTALSLTLLVIVLAGTITLWATASPDGRTPGERPVVGLDAAATVYWQASGTAAARVATPADAVRAQGFIHGMRKAWTMLLWRQTALGDVSGWFGSRTVRLDRHVHRLGIPHTSQRAYLRLPDSTQALLEHYAAGVNAALETSTVQSREELVSLGIPAEPWQPWHTLAIERLFAWLSTPRLSLPDELRDAERDSLRAFLDDDLLLRSWLHVHGLEHSTAWARTTAAADSAVKAERRSQVPLARTSTTLTTRLVTGTTATSVVQDVAITIQPSGSSGSGSSEGIRLTGATLPGTPFFLNGTRAGVSETGRPPGAGGTAWSLLPGSPVQLERVAVDSSQHGTRHVRLSPQGANEVLVVVPRLGGRLPLTVPSPSSGTSLDSLEADTTAADSIAKLRPSQTASDTVQQPIRPPDSVGVAGRRMAAVNDSIAADSVWALDWPGLEAVSDVEAWRRIGRGGTASLTLQDGAGLHVDATGRVLVFGSPPERAETERLTVIGRVGWSRSVAATIHQSRGLTSRDLVRSDSSAWAGVVSDQALPALQRGPAQDSVWVEARTYLQNWDFTYDRSSIGASIFETWMQEYQRETGHLPLLSPSGLFGDRPTVDTTAYFADHRYRRAFRRAVDRLRHDHGTDLRQWRWEEVLLDERSFPVFAADSLVTQDLSTLATTRYAPIQIPAQGHPSTPMGGPSRVDPEASLPATTTWTGWTSPDRSHLIVQRPEFDVQEFFSRPLMRRTDRSAIPLIEVPARPVDASENSSAASSASAEVSTSAERSAPPSTRLIPSTDQ